MKSPGLLAALSALALALPLRATDPPKPPEPRTPRALLQEGLFAEEAERDFAKAGAAYAEALAQFEAQRTLAATALFRLAEVRAHQGQNAEAVALHQRLLIEFPKEEALAKLSRERLTALGSPVPAAGNGEGEITAAEAEELVRLRDMVKNSPDLLDAPDKDGDAPLEKAALKGWLKAATFLLDHGALVDGKPGQWVPLHWAARDGRKAAVELLLARGADPNAATPAGWTALHAASLSDRVEVARVLLDHGAKPDVVLTDMRPYFKADEGTPLLIAIRKGETEMTKLLLAKGASPSFADPQTQVTPLLRAIDLSRPDYVQLLLDSQADVNQAGKLGVTPLILACQRSDVPVAALLLSHGATVDLADQEGFTALHYAAGRSEPLVQSLLVAGASAKASSHEGLTPLHATTSAQQTGYENGPLAGTWQAFEHPFIDVRQEFLSAMLPKIWSALLAGGAEINARDNFGRTALYDACAAPIVPPETIGFLVAQGADFELKTKDGTSAFSAGGIARQAILERRFYYPHLFKEHVISVLDFTGDGSGAEPQKVAPENDSAPAPSFAAIVQKVQAHLAQAQNVKAAIYRADDSGGAKELALIDIPSLNDEEVARAWIAKASEAPALQWGDVIDFTSDPLQVPRRTIPSALPAAPSAPRLGARQRLIQP